MEKMRLLVLVDMPVGTRHERKVRREFLELLFSQGFSELQDSVYGRIAESRSSAAACKKRLRQNAPELGTVRLFVMTEAQFRDGKLLAGTESPQEREVGAALDIFL
ncbi:MAG: CRISPR-associated endonuclease Cas2 [Coriobacteriia bacterium]|nr:CRISPR-associated endonuclease Cas2 [Coriobacteriia bacterium]